MNIFNWILTHKFKSMLYAFMLVAIVDSFYLLMIWPDWEEIDSGRIPESAVIRGYRAQTGKDQKLSQLRWLPSNAQIPLNVTLPFIVAEDINFFSHGGIDTDAIIEAAKYNLKKGRIIRGGSTISQQTTKNLFLSTARTPWRKWHELVLTLVMEVNLSKNRILGIYLNIAEFGEGVYGIEAAARYYFGKSASALSYNEASALAASLPSPKRHNPITQTSYFRARHNRIMTLTQRVGDRIQVFLVDSKKLSRY